MHKEIRYLYIICTLIGFQFNVTSQVLFDYNDISVFFGDRNKSSNTIQSLEKTKSGDLLCVQRKTSFFQMFSKNNSKYTFDLITDYSIPKAKPIKFYGNGEKSNLFNFTYIGNKVLGLSYRASFLDQSPNLFYHLINPQTSGKTNHGFAISSFNSLPKVMDLSRISMVSSVDASYAAIIYIPLTKPKDFTTIKYVILKEDFSILIENEFFFPFASQQYEPLEYFVFNEKQQILITGHYVENPPGNNWQNEDRFFENISISHINNNTLNLTKLNEKGKYFTDVQVLEKNDKLHISALYTSFIDGYIEGTYVAVVNKRGEIIKEFFTPFSKDIRSPQALKNNSFSNQFRTEVEYSKFNIFDIQVLNDGYLISSEYNALEYRYGGTDVPGATNVIDTYYWSSDIIVSKIGQNGQLVWNKVVPKIQRSINDGGYYLSTASYFDSEKLHLFFNDNSQNYSEGGFYNKYGEVPMTSQFSKSKNTIAHVSIDLKDGEIFRKKTLGRAETNVLFVPRLSTSFNSTNTLMIYGQSGNKHRVGSVSFIK